jgi:alkylhydroperoxidase family enzyme
MTEEKKDVQEDVKAVDVVPNEAPSHHAETAQLRINELRQWRELIPRFAIPETADATRRLSQAAAIPAVFIELTNVGVANHTALVRADGVPPAEIRDLVAYADAYVPLADELEAAAQFLRYSTTAARNLAGTEALTTYSLAQRLSRQKRYAHLKPHVADMRRALGKQRKPTPEEAANKAAERAVKAAAKVAPATTRK